MERRACIVASLDRPELTLDLLRHKPEHHGKGEQTTQEDEVHEQSCRQRCLLCHLCTCCKHIAGVFHTVLKVAALCGTSCDQEQVTTVASVLGEHAP